MHVVDWAEGQREDPELGAAITWSKTDFRKECCWTENLAKLKQLMGPVKDTPGWKSSLQDCGQTNFVWRSPISDILHGRCPRHHQMNCPATSTLQKGDRLMP